MPMRRTMLEGFIKKILLVMPTKRNMLEGIILLQTRKMAMIMWMKSLTMASLWIKVKNITGVSLCNSGSHLQ